MFFLSFQNFFGIDGNADLHTSSPFLFFIDFPFSSKTSTSIPSPLFWIWPKITGL